MAQANFSSRQRRDQVLEAVQQFADDRPTWWEVEFVAHDDNRSFSAKVRFLEEKDLLELLDELESLVNHPSQGWGVGSLQRHNCTFDEGLCEQPLEVVDEV